MIDFTLFLKYLVTYYHEEYINIVQISDQGKNS